LGDIIKIYWGFISKILKKSSCGVLDNFFRELIGMVKQLIEIKFLLGLIKINFSSII